MTTEILPNSCRICLKESTKLTSLYSSDEYEETPRGMLLIITGIRLEHEKELSEVPKQICRNCICELNLAYQFRQKALETQSKIDNYCQKIAKDVQIPEALNQIDILNEDISIKPEDTILTTLNNVINTEETVEVLEVCFDDDCETPNSSEHYAKPCTINRETTKRSKRAFSKQKFKIINDSLASATNQLNSLTQTKGRILSKSGRKPKSLEEEQTAFICDICGNMFSKRSRLTEHRHRHETELKYSCELCGERFLMRERLRRHMFQHIGKKPYKCSYCSRTFFYESVKKTHEAVHAGYKPYVCNQCDKAFAYPHSLKKHELIHADIKLYHCNYCNKDFRLQHHMKQHEQTVLHRTALETAEKCTK